MRQTVFKDSAWRKLRSILIPRESSSPSPLRVLDQTLPESSYMWSVYPHNWIIRTFSPQNRNSALARCGVCCGFAICSPRVTEGCKLTQISSRLGFTQGSFVQMTTNLSLRVMFEISAAIQSVIFFIGWWKQESITLTLLKLVDWFWQGEKCNPIPVNL